MSRRWFSDDGRCGCRQAVASSYCKCLLQVPSEGAPSWLASRSSSRALIAERLDRVSEGSLSPPSSTLTCCRQPGRSRTHDTHGERCCVRLCRDGACSLSQCSLDEGPMHHLFITLIYILILFRKNIENKYLHAAGAQQRRALHVGERLLGLQGGPQAQAALGQQARQVPCARVVRGAPRHGHLRRRHSLGSRLPAPDSGWGSLSADDQQLLVACSIALRLHASCIGISHHASRQQHLVQAVILRNCRRKPSGHAGDCEG